MPRASRSLSQARARSTGPVGFWLLAFPCFWSVALARTQPGRSLSRSGLLLLFAVGALVMRAAGCTYNDIVDRDFDAQVARTRARPIPSGQVSVTSAIFFMIVLSLIGFVMLLQIQQLHHLARPRRACRSWRSTPSSSDSAYWPQAVLGLAFNWGALWAGRAVLGRLDWPAVVLYLGAVAWTIGYDTIYAHQDREEDGVLGLKSTALRFGRSTRTWVAVFYALAFLAITAAGVMAHAGTAFLFGMVAAGAHLAWQVATLNIDDPENCLERFRSNRDFGALVLRSHPYRYGACGNILSCDEPAKAQKSTGPRGLSPRGPDDALLLASPFGWLP